MPEKGTLQWAFYVAASPSTHPAEDLVEALRLIYDAKVNEKVTVTTPKLRWRVTLEKDEWEPGWGVTKTVPSKVETRELDDVSAAENWFISDSYFSETYTKRAVWERIDPE